MPTGNNVGGSTVATNITTTTTPPACAVCKYQRKKCSRTCPLAPYFPQSRPKQFFNAHKLFGVSNITKMIKGLTETQREIAMRTIIFQADARARDPVGGCYKIVRELQYQIECCTAELDLVLQRLAVFRTRAQERQELCMGFENLPPEQLLQVVNCQNLLDQIMQQSLVMESNYDDVHEKKMMVMKVPSDEICSIKLEKGEHAMATNQN